MSIPAASNVRKRPFLSTQAVYVDFKRRHRVSTASLPGNVLSAICGARNPKLNYEEEP